MNLLYVMLIVVIIFIIYYIYTTGINEDGFWDGNEEFLKTAGLYNLSVEFDNPNLSIIVKPSETETIVQTYKYKITGNTINITNALSDGLPVLPNGDLTIEQKGTELAITDEKTTYLILTKVEG